MSTRSRIAGRPRRALIVACAAALVLPVSACGAQNPNAAAVVGDTVITEADVNAVSADLAKVPGSREMPTKNVLVSLMLEPYVTAYLKKKGKEISPDQAVAKVLKDVKDPSEATKRFAAFQEGTTLINDADGTAIIADFVKQPITINPRYGAFDPQKGIVDVIPNWMSTPTPTENPNPGVPEGIQPPPQP